MSILYKLRYGYRFAWPVLLLIILMTGCVGIKSDNRDTPATRQGLLLTDPGGEYLQTALAGFAAGNYLEARKDFLQAKNNTDNPKISSQAEFGIILTRMLSAENLTEFSIHQRNFEQFLDRDDEKYLPDRKMTAPFVSAMADNLLMKKRIESLQADYRKALDQLHQAEDDKEALKTRYNISMRKLSELEEKNQSLKNQIKELEELFELIDQQKRLLEQNESRQR